MECSIDMYRLAIGLFVFTLIKLLGARSKKAATDCYNMRKNKFQALLAVLCFLNLLLIGCVESNPGPDTPVNNQIAPISHCTVATQADASTPIVNVPMDNLSHQLEVIVLQVQHQHERLAEQLSQQMRGIKDSITQDIGFIKLSLEKVCEGVQSNTLHIKELETRLSSAETTISALQTTANRTEATLRRKNIKIAGIAESSGETSHCLLSKIIQTLNMYDKSFQYTNDLIEDVRRVGKRGKHCRPVIVHFCKHETTMKIMSNQSARRNMMADNIKISADLTPEQQKQITELNRSGQVGILKNGRVVSVQNKHYNKGYTATSYAGSTQQCGSQRNNECSDHDYMNKPSRRMDKNASRPTPLLGWAPTTSRTQAINFQLLNQGFVAAAAAGDNNATTETPSTTSSAPPQGYSDRQGLQAAVQLGTAGQLDWLPTATGVDPTGGGGGLLASGGDDISPRRPDANQATSPDDRNEMIFPTPAVLSPGVMPTLTPGLAPYNCQQLADTSQPSAFNSSLFYTQGPVTRRMRQQQLQFTPRPTPPPPATATLQPMI